MYTLKSGGLTREQVRGVIARTYFYMADTYGVRLSKQDRRLYTAWNDAYPVEQWELTRNQLVACVMGRGNPYVGSVDLSACR